MLHTMYVAEMFKLGKINRWAIYFFTLLQCSFGRAVPMIALILNFRLLHGLSSIRKTTQSTKNSLWPG